MDHSKSEPEFAGVFMTNDDKLVYFRYSAASSPSKPFTIFSLEKRDFVNPDYGGCQWSNSQIKLTEDQGFIASYSSSTNLN